MAALLQKCTAAVLMMLLGALLVWYQTREILHQTAFAVDLYNRPVSPRNAMKGHNPKFNSRTLKVLQIDSPFNSKASHKNVLESHKSTTQTLQFMCVNETQLWEEIRRNKSLVKLRQYDDIKLALVRAVLDDLDKDSINSDLQFEQYLERFSTEDKNFQQVQKSGSRYYQRVEDSLIRYRDKVPKDSSNPTNNLHSDKNEAQYLKTENSDYLQDSDDGPNNANAMISQRARPNQVRPVFNMPRFDSSKDLNQMWFRPRDNTGLVLHQQPAAGGGPLVSNAGLQKRGDKKLNGANIRMNPDLAQLRNFELPANSDLHTSRHFPSSHNFSALADYMKYLDTAANVSLPKYRSETQYSLNPDLLLRSRFQQEKIEKFCPDNRLTARLPSSIEDLDTLFQHLLYDDSKRIVYCYVPKNGCSNMKRLFLILNGILPPESVAMRPPEPKLKEVKSFRNLSRDEALYRLENYFKFAIVRNPMERLLSAYRNKLEPPLRAELRTLFPDKVKAYILQHYRTAEFIEWLDSENAEIAPSFEEFITFMGRFALSQYNEHFMPVLNLCYPCAVQYDLYLNFKSLNYDINALMDYLDIPKSYYPVEVSHREAPTSTHLNEYFRKLTRGAKERLFRVFADELQFYHALHPEEWPLYRELINHS